MRKFWLLWPVLLALWVGAPVVVYAATPATGGTVTDVFDINSATAAELMALPSIGEVRAQAIVAGRPYKSKDELVRKKIIPAAVYGKIKERIVARQK